jgi:hypothetical protein
MNASTPSGQLADDTPTSEFEGEIREFVRKDVAPWRKRLEPIEQPAENVGTLIQRVAGASLVEIDGVIEELRNMRDFLHNEGDRVQREIAGYVQVSQTAAASMKIIAESMAQWRAAAGAPSTYRG